MPTNSGGRSGLLQDWMKTLGWLRLIRVVAKRGIDINVSALDQIVSSLLSLVATIQEIHSRVETNISQSFILTIK